MPVVCDQGQEPVLGEAAEIAGRDSLGNTNSSGDATSRSTGVNGYVRKDCEIMAAPTLPQIITEQPGCTDTEAQGPWIDMCSPLPAPSAGRIDAVTQADRIAGFGR